LAAESLPESGGNCARRGRPWLHALLGAAYLTLLISGFLHSDGCRRADLRTSGSKPAKPNQQLNISLTVLQWGTELGQALHRRFTEYQVQDTMVEIRS
jgi:hypothetical protein